MSMNLFTGARPTSGLLDPDPVSPARPKISHLAAAAAMCAVLGFLNGAGFLAAVVLGHLALRRIKRSNGRLGGRRIALAAVFVSWTPIVLVALVVVLLFLVGLHVTTHGG